MSSSETVSYYAIEVSCIPDKPGVDVAGLF